jgi:DNA recombination protein RmuC
MYVPSEGVFHEVVNNAELMSLARSQRIYPVSPNTLYAHLQTVLLAFEGQKFEKKAKQVMQLLQALQKDYLKVEENLQVLGKHLNNASSQFQNAQSQFQQIGQKLSNRELLES